MATDPRADAALYRHESHPHAPRDVNAAHRQEREERAARSRWHAVNESLAVWLTAYVGSMWTAYGFAALACVGLLGVLAILSPSVYTLVAWLSQTFIQLVLLPVIMVGQNVNGRHAELQADEMFRTSQRSFHDIEQIVRHLDAQDAELLRQTRLLRKMAGEPEPAPTQPPPAPAPVKRSHHKKKVVA